MLEINKETYLGDGLYASFDGYHVILRAPKLDGDHRVALEPPVLKAFERYVVQLEADKAEWIKAQEEKSDA